MESEELAFTFLHLFRSAAMPKRLVLLSTPCPPDTMWKKFEALLFYCIEFDDESVGAGVAVVPPS